MAFPFLAAAGLIAPFLSQGLNLLGNNYGARKQQQANIDLANLQYKNDMQMMRYQNWYNSPEQQRERYTKAGFNPNLAVTQGTPGNMSSAPSYPSVPAANYQAAYADLGTKLQQSRLLASQADLTEQKVQESGIKQDLMKAQENLVKSNPYMRKEYVDSLVTNMESVARLKQQQANFMTTHGRDDAAAGGSRGMQMMQAQLDTLLRKYDLAGQDQKIKAEILSSKQFQNDLSEIQLNWMRNGDITPQHIYMGIMLLLQKFM